MSVITSTGSSHPLNDDVKMHIENDGKTVLFFTLFGIVPLHRENTFILLMTLMNCYELSYPTETDFHCP